MCSHSCTVEFTLDVKNEDTINGDPIIVYSSDLQGSNPDVIPAHYVSDKEQVWDEDPRGIAILKLGPGP